MGNCIICGTSTDGPICDVHQEDVVFEFEGNQPSQLTPGRFYIGTVDGYADFGVFVNIGNVTGLLHRSKLDRRLESLEWEVGDEICVQVNNVRDNGDIDLDWSIRQSPEDFRGMLVQTPEGDRLLDSAGTDTEDEPTETESKAETEAETETESSEPTEQTAGADEQTGGNPSDADLAETAADTPEAATGEDRTEEGDGDEPAPDIDRTEIESLGDHVGETVRLEGTVASVRQTSGPTVFELRDETGVVDCAAFVEAGVRAYPDIEADDVVRLDGEARLRRDEIQIETESLVALEGEARSAVESRMEEALDDRANPETVEPLADDTAIDAVTDDIGAVATEIRRAVIESRPIVVRHDATTDGYVAGAAIERAVLPLVEAEHAAADAVYHYFDRRPLEDGVYDMNDATKDVTRMLGDRDRHDEKLPLFVFAAAGSTAASLDGLELLDIYDAPRIVLDGRPADDAIEGEIDSLVTVEDRTATTVAAAVAAAVNDDARGDVTHLPAVSYWAETPDVYADLAAEAGIDDEAATRLREAIALEAFYQSYEDKRQLVIDLLFEKRTGLAEQVSEQFETKLEAELDTARPNLEERTVEGTPLTVLDTEAYTHKYDFPPTRLLLDVLARQLDSTVVVGFGTDELHIRSTAELDLGAIVESVSTAVPNAGVSDPGARQPKLEFLAGERDAVIEAVVDAVAEATVAPSA
ncbi:S1 RNA-binding domain-containing protein [Natronomonas sp. F2-12]|jgi:RecJ-like exonuclease|uniref:S1 RNA-binding domain-containing protein n=1 Tax=Natronomonas aquatica TaxID=2841590 RepID=A0A9R1CNV8_9EURY|nr:OB-fold nucleic acid binding domain-containing protein [Natronomonas aquatica]MCQ4332269.1 S1 RNA-binding domain-containing protein [Natronomonas aquatica]